MDLDLEYLPQLGLTPSEQVLRKSVRDSVTQTLLWRMGRRARGEEIRVIRDGQYRNFLGIERFMEKAFRFHFEGDRKAETRACEKFAAGMYKHDCAPPRGDLGTSSAGDPDSANLFVFAEFALAMHQLKESPEIHDEIKRQIIGFSTIIFF